MRIRAAVLERHCSSSTTWPATDVDSFISHRIGLQDVNRGFELMERQDGIRSVIEYA